MTQHGKKMLEAWKKFDKSRRYELRDALQLVKDIAFAKFDESVEMAVRLGVNPRHADQMVRGTVVLPHGLGKSKRVLAIAGGEKQKEATEAGADVVGGEEMVDKIQGGFMDFDAVVATPDMMRAVGKLGKVLGPRGLMPNPKTGTVTEDTAKAVAEVKAGRVEFKLDKNGNVAVPLGKFSFAENQLVENGTAIIEAVVKARLRRADKREAWIWIAVGVSTFLVQEGLKHLIGRPRPLLWPQIIPQSGFSFPSGHAATAPPHSRS
jgi:large subunit ribosomal protein L1